MKRNIGIAIHGGAGTISKKNLPQEIKNKYLVELNNSLNTGYEVLEKKGTALDAVAQAVIYLENSSLFNAGKGSVFTNTGRHQMDACIMDGKTLNAGAVANINNIKNPIELARFVMNNSEHVLLAGELALKFADEQGFEFTPDNYFYIEERYQQYLKVKQANKVTLDHDSKFGTVGAVALDFQGNLASATSTGGMTNKKYGRIGDSPIIGAGTYANNNTCAVSCTGHGEFFLRAVVAHEVSSLIKYTQCTLEEATQQVIHQQLKKIKGKGGLIAIDTQGNISLEYNTKGMYRGQRNRDFAEVKIFD